MIIKDEISKKADDFTELCKSHNVVSLYAFGSSVTDDKFNQETSDIDLLVEVDTADPLERGENLLSLWDAFEIFFNRKVDLLTDSSIKNPYLRKSINATKVLIYDGKRTQVFI
ncbi:MAG: nucleotidyltransferase domain-containing protein [Bacteroidia bacterium]|nr:nucleotidyltransferase domain-containing protein [Bacteroidia bacterium]